MFGYSSDEMLGKSLTTVMPERLRGPHAKGMARYMANGTRHVDWRAVPAIGLRAGGGEFPISISFAETAAGEARAFLGFIRDLSAEEAAARSLRQAQSLRDTLLASVDEGIVGLDERWQVLFANPAAAAILGTDVASLVGTDFHALTRHGVVGDASHELEACPLPARLLSGESVHLQNQQLSRTDGSRVSVEATLTPFAGVDAPRAGIVLAFRGIDDRLRLEDQLRQSQKMEAVGQLAGGIAHDFNNLLTAITGNLGFVRDDLPPDHASQPDLEAIGEAARRAASLVQQLLTFSRKQPSRPEYVAVGDMVLGLERLLRGLIGEEIALEVSAPPSGAGVVIDRSQFEQVLLNLVLNARDAMRTPLHGHAGNGGTLVIDVRETNVSPLRATGDAASVRGSGWVRLRVSDTGHGIAPDVQAHIFEPFFTTKELGAGTGLGLATAFGVIQEAGGRIEVESALGLGTSLAIYLPAVDGADTGRSSAGRRGPHHDSSTVLLVEDEAPVREVARRILERAGYVVLEAVDGVKALDRWQIDRSSIDLVVTDVRMPAMGGVELVSRLRADEPRLPVVFISGYAAPEDSPRAGEWSRFVHKPFAGNELADAVAALLYADRR